MKELGQKHKRSDLGDRMLAYDGSKSAYAAGPLPFNSKEFIIELSDKDGGKFPLDGTEMPIVEYVRQKYNVVLQYAALPVLLASNAADPVYLPMEVCKIVGGQRYQEFGIQVQTELTSIDARVLPPPMIKYHGTGKESQVVPRLGQWNMIDKKMVNGGKVDHWTCVSFSRKIDAGNFCKHLINICCSKGMVFSSGPLIPFQSGNPGQIEETLIDIHSKCTENIRNLEDPRKQLQLLIVILPDASGSYGKIKRVCETELGIVSQCCQPSKASRLDIHYLESVALKINVKVGGRNSVLEQAVQRGIPFLTDRATIIFGGHVTHPQPGEDSSPSIAAVVASMDWPEVTTYRGLVSAQRHGQEIIEGLYKTNETGTVHTGMIREQLFAFRRSTGLKPERIIFYRDGVSEGQFNQVLLHEMNAIRKACLSIEADYLPRVTFVVVQKRHHTRLFPAIHGDCNSTDRSGNILPGTVVDTKICHPTEFDFYLCSHAGNQGTSRPAHYHVLYDENGFSADALQILTNNLCYTYARCAQSVSIVPPVYYAHLAALRARYYMEDNVKDVMATREQIGDVKQLPAVKDNVKDVMYFC